MIFMNEYDIADAEYRLSDADTPVLQAAIQTLSNLSEWVNCNSDGWAYWKPPLKAAAKLMGLIGSVDRFDPQDCTPEEYRAALRPIKAFRTKANRGDGTWGIRHPGTCDFEIVEAA